jgi:hypothetical protein
MDVEDRGDGEAPVACRCSDLLEVDEIRRADEIRDALAKRAVLKLLVRSPQAPQSTARLLDVDDLDSDIARRQP